MITFGCKGCARRRELLRGWWIIVTAALRQTWKTLTEEEGH